MLHTSTIHPTALIGPDVDIGANVHIGPYCHIDGKVTIGNGVRLISHVVIEGEAHIGKDSVVFPFTCIGTPPQDLKYAGEATRTIIGDRTTIRENVTVHRGTAQGGGVTSIGDDCLLMAGCHVAHDCQVGHHVIMATHASLAGHVVLGDYVIMGGLSAVHQHIRIGPHAIIGGMTGIDSDVIPYGRAKGDRGYLAGLNIVGLERRGFSRDDIKLLQQAFNQIFGLDGTLAERIEQAETAYADNKLVQEILNFMRFKTDHPLCRPKRAT